MQLVSDRISLLNPNDKNGVVWKDEQVQAKSGVAPGQIVDWLALMGDAVDNIPGVPGVGPKTAADLLNQFGSIEAMLERLGEVKSEKVRQALRDSAAAIRRNRDLVRLTAVPCEWKPEQLVARQINRAKLRELCVGWGFKGMSAALDATASVEKQTELI
jgi:DNA polymerase-1